MTNSCVLRYSIYTTNTSNCLTNNTCQEHLLRRQVVFVVGYTDGDGVRGVIALVILCEIMERIMLYRKG